MQDINKQIKNDENAEQEAYDCSICFNIMVEPVRIKCGHLYCLDCIEQLIINGKCDNNIKCPMDRMHFDYLEDLKLDKAIQSLNYSFFTKCFYEKANRVVEQRRNKQNFAELTLAYGNFHNLIESNDENKHQWTAFVSVKKIDSSIKNILNILKEEAKVEELIGVGANNNLNYYDSDFNFFNEEYQAKVEFEQKIYNKATRKISLEAENISDKEIIKKVTYKLHPTFTPSSVFVDEAPFKISRIGWGAFNITMIVEFHNHLNIEKVELDHQLNFTKTVSESQKTFLLNMGKFKGY